jgi:hypothetical protein
MEIYLSEMQRGLKNVSPWNGSGSCLVVLVLRRASHKDHIYFRDFLSSFEDNMKDTLDGKFECNETDAVIMRKRHG